ncbi:vesicle coat complex subunit [Tubulinosema ratisbonensis]|uniref:Vesicle coat complex subunit n=1 Tax=Tubulinosema ratisbonensis TaxID=291195 RepID=A0A437AKF6_9MICR|nr:vesicle coat complex subunit [Tubulinosema ratisbonensis]
MFSLAYTAIKDISSYLTNTDSFIEEELTSASILKDLKSRYPSKIRQGLKKVICLIQKNKDVSEYKNEIFKLLDTRDIVCKRLINYFLLHFCDQNEEKERVYEIYTNTLLKDLNDLDEEIKNSALIFLINLQTNSYFDSFFRKIKKLLEFGSLENKIYILILIREYSQRDINFIEKNELSNLILSFFKENNLQLQIYALQCLNTSLSLLNQLSKEEVLRFFTKISNLRKYDLFYTALSASISSLIYFKKSFDSQEISKIIFISKELLSYNFLTAILISDLLLNINSSFAQEILVNLENFLYLKKEDLFFLLKFIYKIIKKYSLNFECKKYVIYEKEEIYLKKIKMLILSLKMNDFAVKEILNLRKDSELILDVLKFCLKNKIKNEEVFNLCEKKYFKESNDLFKIFDPEKITEEETNGKINFESVKFLLDQFRKGIIEKKELFKKLTYFSESNIILHFKIQSLIKDIKEENYELINELIDTRINGIKEKHIFLEEKSDINLEFLKPFIEAETKIIEEEDEFVINEHIKETEEVRDNYCFVEEDLKNKLNFTDENEFIIKNITNIYFSGKIKLVGKILSLKIQSVTKPFIIDCLEFNIQNQLIKEMGEIKLQEVKKLRNFNLKINNTYGYSINFSYLALVHPFRSDILLFNDMFNKLENYKIISKEVIKLQIYVVDRKSFTFLLLNEVFFGKIVDNSVVIKSTDNELLKDFVKCFKE